MLHEILSVESPAFISEIRSDNLPGSEIEFNNVLTHYSLVNAKVAASVGERIFQKHSLEWEPTVEERKEFADELDRKATLLMEMGLHSAGFISEVMPNGCEGAKENRKAMELGVGPTDLPVLDGPYGRGELVSFSDRFRLKESDPRVRLIIDPVEGTTKASLNKDGAVAIIAGTLSGSFSPIPGEDSSALYADRIIAPPRLKGKISFSNTTKENIKLAMREFNLSNPADIKVIVMNRSRNQQLIEDLQKEKVDLDLIESGDLMPALAALTKDKPMLSLGSGGKQEAVIAACAAKALGGGCELRYVTKNGLPSEDYPDTLKLDELVLGNASDYFVNFAAITGVKDLEMLPAQQFGKNWRVQVATITGKTPGMLINNVIV